MKRLVEYVAGRTSDEPVLIHADTWLSASEIVACVETARSSADFRPSLQYRIAGQGDLDLVLGLLAADGWASEIILDPNQGRTTCSDRPTALFSVRRSGSPPSDGPVQPVPKQAHDTRWLLATSGTTGSPKWMPHDLASLTRTTRTDAARGAGLRWGLLYDPRRFAGLQVVLQALLGGSSLVLPSDRGDLDRTIREFRQHHVNAISATPSLWRKLLMAGLAEGHELKIVTLGGEIADAPLLETLRGVFPSARITHIYASTEAGVGFAVTDGREGFPASYLECPPGGVELKVDGEGCLCVRSGSQAPTPNPSPADGGGGPERRLERRYGDGTPIADEEGWICTGDLVERRGDRFHFLGRANGAINVGGNKVHPTEIEDVARSVAGVVLAVARARHSPIVGQVPELLIEADGEVDRTVLEEAVFERCRAELPRVKWPAVVKVVEELALSDMGKVTRCVD